MEKFYIFHLIRYKSALLKYYFSNVLIWTPAVSAFWSSHVCIQFQNRAHITVILALLCMLIGIIYKPPEYPERDFSEAPKFTTPLIDHAATVGYTTKLLCAVRGCPKVSHILSVMDTVHTHTHHQLQCKTVGYERKCWHLRYFLSISFLCRLKHRLSIKIYVCGILLQTKDECHG